MSVLHHAARIAWKDLRIELRSKEIVYTMAFFGGLIVVIYAMAFPIRPELVRAATPGMLWVALAFATWVFVWCWRRWDPITALVALALVATNPTILAHAGLMTTDLPAAFAGFATTIMS